MMGARKKRKCESCGEKRNMAYDGLKLICSDCLRDLQEQTVHLHRNGKLTYQEAEAILMERLQLSRFKAEEILHPPLGKGDFQNPRMAIRMSEHIDMIREMMDNEQSA